MYVDLVDLQEKRKEPISPEVAVVGGAPCSPHLFERIQQVLKVKKVKVSKNKYIEWYKRIFAENAKQIFNHRFFSLVN